jgi:enterochelin esterase-like enzyme
MLDDKKLGKPLQVQVFLPPCYQAAQNSEYPLLVLLHGQGYSSQQWIDLGIQQKASRLMAGGEIPPFVIAMPQEDYFLLDVTQSAFGPAVVNTMLPRLQQGFKVCKTRLCTAIGGISHGAVWAVLLGLQNGNIFGSIGAHSMPANPFPEYYLKDLLAAMPDKPRFYMDSGRSDMYLPDAVRFENSLNNIRLPHLWVLQDGEHNDAYWQAHVEDYLHWYAVPWNKAP